jgi:DNA ligase-1
VKPMLAGKLDSLDDVKWPVLATPKVDGIRCLITTDGPVSRKLKPIPNRYVREALIHAGLPVGLDGELWVPGATCFGDVSAAIMARDCEPRFEYLVFDHFGEPEDPYHVRALRVARYCRIRELGWLRPLEPVACFTEGELLRFEEECLAAGFEGVMLRSPDGPYKFGRSTVREGYLTKWKRFEDAEALVVGYSELMHNDNEATVDALGHTKRSTHKAGKRPGGVLGKLICVPLDAPPDYDPEIEFEVGGGFTAAQRAELWAQRGDLPGRIVKYRHFPHGAKDKPRFPVFLGFRHPDDM